MTTLIPKMTMCSQYSSLYKKRNLKQNYQTERRLFLLNDQKRQRHEQLDDLRGIQEFVQNLKYKTQQSNKKYSNYLQLSEWLKEKPTDLRNWYLVPCPKGVRCIVVAAGGNTEVYNKYGLFTTSFRSGLPGDIQNKNVVTILDCIFIKKTSEYYVLDVLAYANQDMINCEVAFRFFWMGGKIREDNLSTISARNEFAFTAITYIDCADEQSLGECLTKYPMFNDNTPELDGLLFYHKESSYVHGRSPLVGWLYPFMIPEVFGTYFVHPIYLTQKPSNYINYLLYIEEFDKADIKKKKHRRKKKNNKDNMECDIEDINSLDAECEANKLLEMDGANVDDIYYGTME